MTGPVTAKYRLHPRVLLRSLSSGALVTRWDLDVDPVVLNPSAYSVLVATAGDEPLDHDQLVEFIARSTDNSAIDIGSLHGVLDELTELGVVERFPT